MKSCLILIAAIASFQTFAEPLPADTAGKLTEIVYVRGYAAVKFGDLETASVLSEVHRADMQRYIKSHHLEEVALPEMEWKYESPVITIRQGGKSLKVDFSKMPGSKQLVINGETLTIQPNATFEQVTDQIARAGGGRAAANVFKFFEPSAFAADGESMSALGAYGYYTGLDQLYACMSGEAVTISTCKLKLNSSMILTDLTGQSQQLIDFRCEGGKFKSATTAVNEGKYHIQVDTGYDDKGELTLLTTKQDGSVTCRYQLKDGKLTGMDRLASGSYCDGRAEGDGSVETHKFHKGDVPRRVATSEAPIQRMKDCCEVAGCQKTLMEAAAKNRAKGLSSSPASTTK